MQKDFKQKRNSFRTQIRRENLNKIFELRRIQPKLIIYDVDTLQVLCDGLEIIAKQSSDYEMLEALKSICYCLKHYQFSGINKRLIEKIFYNIKWFIKDSQRCDLVRQISAQIFQLICLQFPQIVKIEDFSFQVLISCNIKSIKSTLFSIITIIQNIDKNRVSEISYLFKDDQIFEILLELLANFADKKQAFAYFKKTFIITATSLCYIAFRLRLDPKQKWYLQLLQFCVKQLQKDVVWEAEKDQTLKIYFQNSPVIFTNLHYSQCILESSYPFGILQQLLFLLNRLSAKMVHSGVNCDVTFALIKCLSYQIRQVCVKQPLVKTLLTIFFETFTFFEADLRNQIFHYIFNMEYTFLEEDGYLLELLILMNNDYSNHQTMDQSLFIAMGDPFHKIYPKTCKLLKLAEYLQIRQCFNVQEQLFLLIQNYATINSSWEYLEQVFPILMKFAEGKKMILRNLQVTYDPGYGQNMEIQSNQETRDSMEYQNQI